MEFHQRQQQSTNITLIDSPIFRGGSTRQEERRSVVFSYDRDENMAECMDLAARFNDCRNYLPSCGRSVAHTSKDDFGSNSRRVAEPLQLVRYEVGDEYKPHYSTTLVSPIRHTLINPTRWAALIFYLNNVERGGETSFPRWSTADAADKPLVVTPQPGKAILFYLQVLYVHGFIAYMECW